MRYPIHENNSRFDEALINFEHFQPVRVLHELKDEFNSAITKHSIKEDIGRMSYTIIPQKSTYKFIRTK